MELPTLTLLKFSLLRASVIVISCLFSTASFAVIITGKSVSGLSDGLTVEDNFMAKGLILFAQSRIDNNVGFLSVDGNDVLSYTANQALSSFGNYIVDFDSDNDSQAASSIITNLTAVDLNVWIGDLDGDPTTGQANTYDFLSSAGQSLLGKRFFNGTFNPAIEVTLSAGEALTVSTIASDANPRQLGDDGRYITIAEAVVPEPSTISLIGLALFISVLQLFIRITKNAYAFDS